MIKYFIEKLRRAYWHFLNSDPIRNCQVYKDEGCSLVDGPFCNFPKCSILYDYNGTEWVACCGCIYNEDCISPKYGLGCFEGKKEQEYNRDENSNLYTNIQGNS